MSRVAAYTALQDAFGKENAQALAEYLESQEENVATRDDLQQTRSELKADIQTL